MRLHFNEYNFGVILFFLGLLSLAGGMFLYKVDGDDCVGRIIATIVISTGLFSWYLAFHFIETFSAGRMKGYVVQQILTV